MINFKKRLIYFLLFIFAISSIDIFGQSNKNLPKYELVIISQNKNKKVLTIELANTPKSRTYGLMNRKKMAYNSGMYFVFKNERYLNFWMKNVTIPLSIAYIDKNGVIKQILKMKPLDTSILYPSKYPVKYALEVNQGWFKKNNIKTGSKVYLNGRVGK
jgi:uncharacterized membrane protein (UPF0127 family)